MKAEKEWPSLKTARHTWCRAGNRLYATSEAGIAWKVLGEEKPGTFLLARADNGERRRIVVKEKSARRRLRTWLRADEIRRERARDARLARFRDVLAETLGAGPYVGIRAWYFRRLVERLARGGRVLRSPRSETVYIRTRRGMWYRVSWHRIPPIAYHVVQERDVRVPGTPAVICVDRISRPDFAGV